MGQSVRYGRAIPPRPTARQPRVSVVIPVYNYARYLGACVASVLGQPGVDLDVLIADDASTDDSLAVARAIAERDSRVRVVANVVNRGHIPTVNSGLAAVDGEYLVKLDADDLLTPGSLARSVALLDAYPSVGFVYGRPLIFTGDQPPPPATELRSWTVWPGRGWLSRTCRRATNVIRQPEVMMRRAAVIEAGLYSEHLPHTSDLGMWLGLSGRHDVGWLSGPHQGSYREHPLSMSRTVHGGVVTDIRGRLAAFDAFFDGRPDLPAGEDLREVAHRALAKESVGYAINAYRRGVADSEPVGEYAALAREVWPAIDGSWEGRLLTRLGETDASAQTPAVLAHEILRDVRYRLRWRRWHWTGV